MTGRIFVDTNVLVYARDGSNLGKQREAFRWLEHLWHSNQGRISVQVLQEYYVTVTRKLDPGMDRTAARRDVRNLIAWNPIQADEAILEKAWALEDRFELTWWDALIVSAAQALNCRYLLTEDFQDGQVFDRIEAVNPFSHEPSSLV